MAAEGRERTTRPRGWSVLAWGQHSQRGAHAGWFYSKIPAIFEELS